MKLEIGKTYRNKDVLFTTKIERIDTDGTVWFKVGSVFTPLSSKVFEENYIPID